MSRDYFDEHVIRELRVVRRCLTCEGEPPVLEQLVAVQLRPGQHEAQLASRQAVLSITSTVSIRTFAFPSA